MKRRLAYAFIVGGSVTFVASLYLPWCVTWFAPRLAGFPKVEGWDGGFGEIAGLSALAVGAVALAAIIKPGLKSLPLGGTGLALGVFALLSVSQLWAEAVDAALPHNSVRLAVGAYLGLAAAGVVCIAAAALCWDELARRRSMVALAGQAFALVLLVSVMLLGVTAPRFAFDGDVLPVLVCVAACLALATWAREGQAGLRLASAAGVATLLSAYLALDAPSPSVWPYAIWMVAACALALLVLGLFDLRTVRIRPSAFGALTVVGAALVLVALFLPWKGVVHFADGSSSPAARGWSLEDGAMAGGLVTLWLVDWVCRRRVVAELAVGAALYLAWAAFGDVPALSDLRYGALPGFVGAGLLVVAGVRSVRPITPKQLVVRSAPIVACLALVSFALAATTTTLLTIADGKSPWFWWHAFLGAAVILISLRLLRLWTARQPVSAEVALLPLGLLALTVLNLLYLATSGQIDLGGSFAVPPQAIGWVGWLSLVLCLLLAAFGRFEWKSASRPTTTDGGAWTTSLATRS